MTTTMTVVSLVVLLAILAVVFDLGRMGICRQQLQGAGDAAVLAAAQQLAASGDIDLASEAAQAFIDEAFDSGAITPQDQLPHGELKFGYVDENDVFVELDPNSDGITAVQIRLGHTVRDGNPLPLFVTKWFGAAASDVEIVACATVDSRLAGFAAPGEGTVPCVPLVLRQSAADAGWLDQSQQEATTFNDRWSLGDAGQMPGGDGIPELVFRIPTRSVSADSSDPSLTPRVAMDDASGWAAQLGDGSSLALARQIRDGLSTADLAEREGRLQLAGDAPLTMPARDDASPEELVAALQSIQGQPRVWPLGQRNSRGTLEVTSFAAGQVVECYADRGGIVLLVQPCLLQTETAVMRPDAAENPWIGKLVLAR